MIQPKQYKVTVTMRGVTYSSVVTARNEESAFLQAVPNYLFRKMGECTLEDNLQYDVIEWTPEQAAREEMYAEMRQWTQ